MGTLFMVYTMFSKIFEFEREIAKFTGARYAITTDCCTHAIELCLLLDSVKKCSFTAFTYISVVQTMRKLSVEYSLLNQHWSGEYLFHGTRIWDSARLFKPGMYRSGQLQCLSFGYSKPLDIGRGGAILTDSETDYVALSKMRYDGRDIAITPWNEQHVFETGYHYKLNPEECVRGLEKLENYIEKDEFEIIDNEYPDCRKINFR